MNPFRFYPLILVLCAAVAALVAFAPTPSNAAAPKARHGAALVSCAALQARSMTVLGADTYRPPHPEGDMADARRLLPDVAVKWQAENDAAAAAFRPYGTRDYMIWLETEHRCLGIDHGLDKPMDKVIEVQVRQTITVEREP